MNVIRTLHRHFPRAAVVSLLAGALLTMSGRIAGAQSATGFGVAAGAALPVGNYLNGLNSGYNVTVSLGITTTTSPMGFRIEGTYNEMGFPGGGASHRIAAGIANLTYDLQGMSGSKTSGLYVIGGAGLYASYDRGTDQFGYNYDQTGTQTNVGLNGGLGYRFPLTDMSAYIEGRIHVVFTNNNTPGDPNYNAGNATFIPITFGISF